MSQQNRHHRDRKRQPGAEINQALERCPQRDEGARGACPGHCRGQKRQQEQGQVEAWNPERRQRGPPCIDRLRRALKARHIAQNWRDSLVCAVFIHLRTAAAPPGLKWARRLRPRIFPPRCRREPLLRAFQSCQEWRENYRDVLRRMLLLSRLVPFARS